MTIGSQANLPTLHMFIYFSIIHVYSHSLIYFCTLSIYTCIVFLFNQPKAGRKTLCIFILSAYIFVQCFYLIGSEQDESSVTIYLIKYGARVAPNHLLNCYIYIQNGLAYILCFGLLPGQGRSYCYIFVYKQPLCKAWAKGCEVYTGDDI